MLKNKLVVLATLILSCIFQLVSLNQDSSKYFQNGFMIGLDNEFVYGNVVFALFPLLLPICFILFFTSGSLENLIQGYGKILIVRSYSKTVLILKRCLSNAITLICIILFQIIIFLSINKNLLPVENGVLKSLLMYFLTLNALVMLQNLFEIYFPAHFVNIIIFIYCYISYYFTQIIFKTPAAKIILFPCLMFGMQNGAVNSDNTYYLYLSAIIVINLLILSVLIRMFKKTDIF